MAVGLYYGGRTATANVIQPHYLLATARAKKTSNKGTQTMLPCLFCRTVMSSRRRTVGSTLRMPHEEQEPAHLLKQIEDEFWAWRLRDSPMLATSVGETRFNDIFESYELDTYTQRKNAVEDFLLRLKAVTKNELDKEERLDFDIFQDHLQTYLDGARWNSYFAMNNVNFLEGINADPGRLQTVMPMSTVGDFENYLERLRKRPTQIAEKIELLKIAVATGKTLNKVSVADVPSQIDGITSVDVQESPFFQPVFTSTLEDSDLDEEKRESLRSRAVDVIMDLNQSLERLKVFLQTVYFPACRPSWGVSGWPDGQEVYQACLRYHTSTNMTPHQVHDLGLREVARIRSNMYACLERLQYNGSIKEFYEKIRKDPKFHANSGDELLEMYEEYIYDRIYPKIHKLFKDIPNLPLDVQEMPYDGPGGVYLGGTPDGSVPGIFYANVDNPEDTATIGIMSLVLHETIPGHHLQSIFSITSDIPKYRALVEDDHYYRMPATFPINTAYIEGWGLYAEYLGEEMGLYTDDYMLMGRYSEEIFRACRLVVDTGLNFFNWEREQAIQYMLDNTAESRDILATEIDRYLTWPGQATAYKIGEIRIKELRQKAADSLGDKFELPEFHSVILENGGMPLNLLERLVDHWIEEQQECDGPVSNGGPGESSAIG